jgi:hypothetical protein
MGLDCLRLVTDLARQAPQFDFLGEYLVGDPLIELDDLAADLLKLSLAAAVFLRGEHLPAD